MATHWPKNGTLNSKMRPCRLIQFRIASRRNTVNPTPCTSLGERTAGGLNLLGVDVSHRLTMAGSVMRSPKLRCSSESLLDECERDGSHHRATCQGNRRSRAA